MQEFSFASYCGLNCGACEIRVAYRKGLAAHTVPQWEDQPDPIRKNLKRAKIQCHGCKTDTVFQGCAICPVRKCARNKPEIETCLDCGKELDTPGNFIQGTKACKQG